MKIPNLRKVEGLINRNLQDISMTISPKNNDGNYYLLLNTKNEMDDDLLNKFKKIPSVQISHIQIPPDERGFTNKYSIWVSDKKSKWV